MVRAEASKASRGEIARQRHTPHASVGVGVVLFACVCVSVFVFTNSYTMCARASQR